MKVADVVVKQPESSEITGNTWTVSLPKTGIHTLEQLVEYCEIDLGIWEVERFICNKWEMAARLGAEKDERIAVTPLFQVKATFRKKVEIVDAREEIEELKALAAVDRVPVVVKHKPHGGHMLEVNIPDPHFGKLAWAAETGSNYDTKIASDLFRKAVSVLLSRVSAYEFEEVLFVVGNDLLNSDDIEGQTTKGTKVSTDGRYQKTFGVVRNIIIETIERLRLIAKVKVVMIPGNHDALSVWHLGDSLECYFHKYKDVEIDNSPKSRKYYRFGSVMLMFTHGDKGKRTDYPLLMATEQAEMFGQTKFREAHTGHRHMTKLDEQHGVRIRVLPALCPADDWHFENGFTGNMRNAEAYIWNKDEGLVGMAIFSDGR